MTTESYDEQDVRMDLGTLFGAIFSRWLRILVVTLILVGIAYAVLMFVPKMYESQSSILVETRENAFTQPTSGIPTTSSGITVEATVSSQIELIKSRDTLLRVIDQLGLRDVAEFNGSSDSNPLGMIFSFLGRKPSASNIDETVLANLNDRLTVIRERDSTIISIFARSRDPQLAADIANAVASAHVQRRADLSLQDTAEASVWLEQEIVKLRERVNAAETAVANFKVDNDLFAGTNNTSLLDQQLSAISGQITTAQERRNTAQSRAALIRNLIEAGQPIDGIPDVQQSVVIQQMSQTKATLQGELAQREATLLPNHPTIKALKAQIAEIQQQINNEARRVVSALEAEAQIESELVTSLQAELTRAKTSASSATTSTVQLDGLEREAKAQRDLLESYLLRYRDAIARSDSSSALPDVRVITVAAPTVTPASPKVSLILAAVAFVAIALQAGGIIFSELVSGRALVVREGEYEAEFAPVAAAPVAAVVVEESEPMPAFDEMTTPPAFTAAEEPPAEELPPAPTPSEEYMPAVTAAAASAAAITAAATAMAMSDTAASRPAPELTPAAVPPAPETIATTDVPAMPETPASVPDAIEVAQTAARKGKTTPRMPKSKASKAAAVAAAAAAAAPLLAPTYEARAQKALEVSNLSADLALGRSRVVMVAGLADQKDVLALTDRLLADALHNGLSIARVDAGSGQTSSDPGLTDLAAELASFGDVVHRGSRDGLAEVPWGQQQTLDRESAKPQTLIEALTDIYEAVVVMSGVIGRNAALTSFSGMDCRLVIVGDDRATPEAIEAALSEAAALGYHPVQFMVAAAHHAEVA